MVTEPIQEEVGKRASAASSELEDGWQEYASRIKRAKANTPEDKDIEIQEFEADLADFDESMNDDQELEGAELSEDIDPKLRRGRPEGGDRLHGEPGHVGEVHQRGVQDQHGPRAREHQVG